MAAKASLRSSTRTPAVLLPVTRPKCRIAVPSTREITPGGSYGAASRRRSTRICAEGANGAASGIIHFAERSQETLRSIFIKALPGPLAWSPSYLVPLTAGLSIYGAVNGHHFLHHLAAMQAPGWFPMANTLQTAYLQDAGLWDVACDTLLSTLGSLFIFLGLPAMDLLLGLDPKTPGQVAGDDRTYRAMLHSHLLLHWAVLYGACAAIGGSEVHPVTLLGLTSSMGCAGALVFTVAHELLHSPRKLDKTLASAGLLPLAYMHWVPSHLAHHRNVGKPEDATTARLGEALYTFVPRSILGNLKDGVRSELCRLESRQLSVLSLQNRMFQWAGGPIALLAAVYTLWGPSAAVLGVGQAAFAILMLEDVNYIEHYGLRRKKLPNGRYERTSILHSWNANWLFTNSIIFSVQRHSDHHAHAHKPFQRLEDISDAPQLPASYSLMMLLALLPGIFFDVMDPRAQQVAQHGRVHTHRLD